MLGRSVAVGCLGPFITFASAIQLRKLIWLSRHTTRKHPTLKALIQVAVNHAGSKWKLLASKRQFLDASTQHRFAICTKSEVAGDKQLRKIKNVLTKEQFLSKISIVRSKRLGLAGLQSP
jgi:hypothetical protein